MLENERRRMNGPDPLAPALLARLEDALDTDSLPKLMADLRAEGLTIGQAYQLVYGDYQTHLRSAGDTPAVERLLQACDAAQTALARTFDPQLQARLDHGLQLGIHDFVAQLHDEQGWSKQRIYDALSTYIFVLRAAGREEDEDHICDVLDVLTGWCSASRRLWPDEELTP